MRADARARRLKPSSRAPHPRVRTSPAASTPSPEETSIPATAPHVLLATRSRDRLVERLSRRFPRAGLDGVLADLDRTAGPCEVPGRAAGRGFTWEERDRDDPTWWPQGMATLRSGGVLLASWYARRNRLGRTQGARISVIDRTTPESPRYRHVLLVVPRRLLGLLTVRPLPVHAGGIAVHGNVLHVADTLFGVRVFRLGDVLRVPRHPRGWWSLLRRGGRGYDYVLPQLTAFRPPLRWGTRRLRYSFLSTGNLGGGPGLVVGEYRRARQAPPRLARYRLDPRTGLPADDGDGRWRPVEVYEGQPSRMQGAAVHGTAWFVTASAGEDVPGDLYVGAPGAWVRHRGVLPGGPEDLAWSRPGEELWCLSEWPGRRWVFPIATGPWQGRPDGGTEAAGGPAGRVDLPDRT